MTPPKITKQFNQERLMNILLGPQVSEKATYVGDKHKQVIFRVTTDATKPEIKAAVELMFKVNVEGVQVAVVKVRKSVSVQLWGGARTGKKPTSAWRPARKSILLRMSKDNYHGTRQT